MGNSSKSNQKKETPEKLIRTRNDPRLRLWMTHQQESVFFQREVQVNFWTVLGGLALGALLTRLSSLQIEILAGRWHLLLYMVASILVIANSWVQTAWGSLVMKWPISIATTIFVLFGMFSQSIQCLQVTNPAGWMAATAGIILFALLIQIYFMRSGAWAVYSPDSIKQYTFVNYLYVILMLVCLGGAYQLYRYPSNLAEMIWGFVALCLSILALYMQHKGMKMERKRMEIP